MKSLDEMIAVMQAFKDGQKVRNCFRKEPEWRRCKDPVWNWALYDYEVVPEPREIFVNEYEDGKYKDCLGGKFESRAKADKMALPERIRCVRFVEDMDYEG